MFTVLRRQIKLGTRMRPKCSPVLSEQMAAQGATGNSAQVFKVTEKNDKCSNLVKVTKLRGIYTRKPYYLSSEKNCTNCEKYQRVNLPLVPSAAQP
jgi:hypothetical protein